MIAIYSVSEGKRKTDDSDVSDTDSDDEFLSKMANSEEELNDSDSDPSWNPAAVTANNIVFDCYAGLGIRVVLWPRSTKTSVGSPDKARWWSGGLLENSP